MPNSPNIANNVPLMYRAQVEGRCQIQRLIPKAPEQDAERWADEWVHHATPQAPEFGAGVQTRTYAISWRFITNSGQDDGVIRPVIGARGWPFYPGSSMKGLFRQAAERMEKARELESGVCNRLCGIESQQDPSPGILRFHGGYPANISWTKNLVDIVHPQQPWQVGIPEKKGGAFIQISLYKPKLKFGISTIETLTETEWEQVWQIWAASLSMGIGCRVSAGYGQHSQSDGNVLYKANLGGQGQAPKLVNSQGEFRPNIFRASIRGHALRIFGGLTDARTAQKLVNNLFGGIGRDGATVGLLSIAFRETQLEIQDFGQDEYNQPTYEVKGELLWKLTRKIPNSDKQILVKLIQALNRFAMILGGFGKSWRRADHRLFYPDYYQRGHKPLIGCHWYWLSQTHHLHSVTTTTFCDEVSQFVQEVRNVAVEWIESQNFVVSPGRYAHNWREAWHPKKVEIWGRFATSTDRNEVSKAIKWFHGSYLNTGSYLPKEKCSIHQSSLTGGYRNNRMDVGRIWHRLYPILDSGSFLELLTIFPESSSDVSDYFLGFLDETQQDFQKIWPPGD